MKFQATPSGQYFDSAIRIKVLCSLLGLSRSTIYGKINPSSSQYDATFPKPFKIGVAAVAWSRNEVSKWLEAMKEKGTK